MAFIIERPTIRRSVRRAPGAAAPVAAGAAALVLLRLAAAHGHAHEHALLLAWHRHQQIVEQVSGMAQKRGIQSNEWRGWASSVSPSRRPSAG